MKLLPRLSLLLLVVGFVLLFVQWRLGLALMGVCGVLTVYAWNDRRLERRRRKREVHTSLMERRWLERTRWFSREQKREL